MSVDFTALTVGTKIWNSAWPKTTYLVIADLNRKVEAQALQHQGVNPPYLAEPTVRKIIIHQEIGTLVYEDIWKANQTALLDVGWTLIEPGTEH